jgi:hypothetical protein
LARYTKSASLEHWRRCGPRRPRYKNGGAYRHWTTASRGAARWMKNTPASKEIQRYHQWAKYRGKDKSAWRHQKHSGFGPELLRDVLFRRRA